MSAFNNPFSPDVRLGAACACGKHRSRVEHDAEAAPSRDEPAGNDTEMLNGRVIQSAVMRALFPRDETRRRFLAAVGSSGALAAVSSVVPFGALEAMAQDKGALEKKDLKIGFIPITCATPLIMADPLGFYRKQGLNVTLNKTAGWALIRDKMLNKEHDASHFLSPMPLAISLGLGSAAQAMNVATIQNINGQAITLHVKHKDKRDPKQWKGFRFAVPFDYSMHNFLLRYYVAEHGLDPDTESRSASRRRRRWSRTCAPEHRRLPRPRSLQPACGLRRGRLHPHSVKELWTGIPAALSAYRTRSSRRIPTPSRRSTARCSPRRRWRARRATGS